MTRTNNMRNTAADTAHLPAFQTYYEIETVIPSDHHLVLDVPESVPVGPVWLAIIYQTPAVPPAQGIKELLLSMPDVGSDDDFARQKDLSRAGLSWDS